MIRRVIVIGLIGLTIVVALLIGGRYFGDGEPAHFENEIAHFKYGSIGAEVDGYPYLIWLALPVVFADRLPDGYKSFGFIEEPDQALPVGVSVRRYNIERVGFNCATCHSTTIDNGDLILGAPAVQLDLQAYADFLLQSSVDDRFEADHIFAALEGLGRQPGLLDRIIYRLIIIPLVRREAARVIEDNRWMSMRPRFGPGRTDAGNPWRFKFGLHPEKDNVVSTVDFPSIWNQRIRMGAWLHWDGNNNSLTERNLSAALAGGASEESLDMPSIERVAAWSIEAPAPRYPYSIDAELAALGQQVYLDSDCGDCHDPGGTRYGLTTPIDEVATDSERFNAFSSELLAMFSTVGEGTPWQFRHYKKSDGYANSPLDGIWARAPFLHNGAVPTLADLLKVPEERPTAFHRGCNAFDIEKVGFRCESGFAFDTTLAGNSNAGHVYGTNLSLTNKAALLEYLKTL